MIQATTSGVGNMMQATFSYNTPERSQQEQVQHWNHELSRLSNPQTYRERVLANVYRQLIHSRSDQSCARNPVLQSGEG